MPRRKRPYGDPERKGAMPVVKLVLLIVALAILIAAWNFMQ